jgi:hypothetical protein
LSACLIFLMHRSDWGRASFQACALALCGTGVAQNVRLRRLSEMHDAERGCREERRCAAHTHAHVSKPGPWCGCQSAIGKSRTGCTFHNLCQGRRAESPKRAPPAAASRMAGRVGAHRANPLRCSNAAVWMRKRSYPRARQLPRNTPYFVTDAWRTKCLGLGSLPRQRGQLALSWCWLPNSHHLLLRGLAADTNSAPPESDHHGGARRLVHRPCCPWLRPSSPHKVMPLGSQP